MSRPDMTWPERRSDRIHVRVAPELKHTVEEAAREIGISMSEFVTSAVREKADEVLAKRTVVDPAYYDALLAALDEPPRMVPELLEAIAKRTTVDA